LGFVKTTGAEPLGLPTEPYLAKIEVSAQPLVNAKTRQAVATTSDVIQVIAWGDANAVKA